MGELRYGFQKELKDTPYEKAVEKVTAALQEQGFGIMTTIDVKQTLKKKLDQEFRRYVILGACNPNLAHRALEAEPQIGLLLPCNVVVQETSGGGSMVSVAAPKAMFTLVENESIAAVAEEADRRLRKVLEALK